jgi:hypothetical protein
MTTTPAHTETSHDQFHAVRFYVDDLALCRMVGGFVGDGLAAGQPAVVIATPSHRDCILEMLGSLAFDVARLVSSGELQLLDAEQTLSAFMKEGHPDPVGFAAVIGAVLQRARGVRPHATVRAYGEMVDWLWKHDACEAAIRLELLWNDLANRYPFSLLCGYSMGNFYKQGSYEEICRHHTHVLSESGQHTRVRID